MQEVTGRLRRAPVGRGPVVLVADDGRRWEPQWPPAWRWHGDVLHDDSGMPVARLGAVVRVRGREASDRQTSAQVGPVLVVDEVRTRGR